MRTRLFALLALFVLVAAALPAGMSVQAQQRPDIPRVTPDRPQLAPGQELVDGSGGPLLQRDGTTKVVIELSDAPTTQAFAAAQVSVAAAQATAIAQQQLARIERAQQSLLSALRAPAIDAQVIYRTQRVYNGIAVRVDAAKLDQIRQLPGVKAVRPLVTKYLDNESSVPLIGAPRLWDDTISGDVRNDGRGMRIGIIDTGIDYLHTDFGGPGTGYEANDTTIITDDPFPTAKVTGGYDFVGDDYNASCTEEEEAAGDCTAIPQPDPDPMDCNGHGTHVAGTAAGFGVRENGSTYNGTYYATMYDDTEFRIGPGVAPRAELYALRVFGCAGSTDVVETALEWSVDPNGDGDFSDRLDVVNMSLGSPFGGVEDPSGVASDNAALAGVIVVTSAGNESDAFYNTGSPGTAERAISVAASVDSTSILDGIRVDAADNRIDGDYGASRSVLYDWDANDPVTGLLVYPPTQRTGCEAFSAENRALIAGKIVLLDWTEGQCGSVVRGRNAREAGAIGFILIDTPPVFDLLISGDPIIPGYSAPSQVGDTLKAALAAGGEVRVTLGLEELFNSVRFVDEDIEDTLAAFSSRGVGRGSTVVKPDITAPGHTIFSAAALSGNEGASFNGTSMAAPHIAGTMALLKQLHPDWSVEELKALVMNTAIHDIRALPADDSPIFGPGRVGAGRVDVPAARDAETIAYNATNPGMVSASFGAVEVVGSETDSKMIRVDNKSDSTRTYTLTYRSVTDIPGVEYELSTEELTIEAGDFAVFRVNMTADASEMRHVRDAASAELQTLARHWLSEESGYINVTSGNEMLRVPVYAAARPASNMRASEGSLEFSSTEALTATIVLTGEDVLTGTDFPTDTVSLVSAYELQHTDPNEIGPRISDNADLQHIGVTSDYMTTRDVRNTTIAFGISTYADWATPTEVEFDIYIDTNRDGEDDFVLYNTNLGSATGADASDVFVTVLVNLNTNRASLQHFINGASASEFNTVPFNTNVIMMAVDAAALGMSSGSAAFDYRVVTFSRDYEGDDGDDVVDQTPTLTFNAARPGVEFTSETAFEGYPVFLDVAGAEIGVRFNAAAFNDNNSQGVLLLHHHNTSGRRAEVVTIRGALENFPYNLYLPLVFNGGPVPGGR